MGVSKDKDNSTSNKAESGEFRYDPTKEESLKDDGDDEDSGGRGGGDNESHSEDYDGETTTSDDADEMSHRASESGFGEKFAAKLTRDVRVWRSVVSFMLLATAAIVTVSTYIFLTNEEAQRFTQAFDSLALTVGDATEFHAKAINDALEARAQEITSYAIDTGAAWPFVTVPHFEQRGENTRTATRSQLFGFCPLVQTDTEKAVWPTYANHNQDWLIESYQQVRHANQQARIEAKLDGEDFVVLVKEDAYPNPDEYDQVRIPPNVYRVEGDWEFVPENSPGDWMPYWQLSPPPPQPYPINFNLMSSWDVYHMVNYMKNNRTMPLLTGRLARNPMINRIDKLYDGLTDKKDIHHVKAITADPSLPPSTSTRRELLLLEEDHPKVRELGHMSLNYTDVEPEYVNELGHAFLLYPVAKNFDIGQRTLAAVLWATLRWDWILSDLLPENSQTIVVVIANTCGETELSYSIQGRDAIFLGPGDDHEQIYDKKMIETTITNFHGLTLDGQVCDFMLRMYPTTEFQQAYTTDNAIIYTAILATVFACTAIFFFCYVRIVQRRQKKVMETAARTNAIVSSLFPSNVRERIMRDAEDQAKNKQDIANFAAPFLPGMGEAPKMKLKSFLDDEKGKKGGESQLVMFQTKPIADLFPECTVLFADLVGFTAWSSVREPTQVFQLLETIYHGFDEIARRRRVFKVETIGDCYVAVTGLPDPRKDHAVVMCRFARDCMQTMADLTKKLEVTLGPDTGDLNMRMGLHSGPVTAGVLRGEKSRFQLFGDTVNTAARMESTGAPGRIHLSTETMDYLQAAGKSNWIKAREEKVHAKGKGELQTYWLEKTHDGTASVASGSSNSDHGYENSSSNLMMPQPAHKLMDEGAVQRTLDAKSKRLVDWNCDQLVRLLKLIVARRNAQERVSSLNREETESFISKQMKRVGHVIDEVREIINLPKFDPSVYRNHDDPDSVKLDDEVVRQLHEYVSTVATFYRDNPFHNFEHASHVTMSVSKLLSRIVSPQDINRPGKETETGEKKIEDYAWEVHTSTYGITSDPLTQFAVVFSALVHDVDHCGVPNATLVKENAEVAQKYGPRSVAEQNSVDLAWNMLMDKKYSALQSVLCANMEELERFRQLVVNTVMATDIVDKDLKDVRNAKWAKAFKDNVETDPDEDVNRKATIVIEHLIQASDVAHTMQHWHIFRKWNERLYNEMYKAYLNGSADKDPTEFWYKGEIGFFDFYIIPLAKKLKECGVFGVSSDEYLNYATKNREEWVVKGEDIVKEMKARVPPKNAAPLDAPASGNVDMPEQAPPPRANQKRRSCGGKNT